MILHFHYHSAPNILLYLFLKFIYIVFLVSYFVFIFWLHHAAFGILVPQPGIEPSPPALEAQSLNHWTTREVPYYTIILVRVS